MESGDDVLNLVSIWERKFVEIPVRHHKLEVASTIDLVSDFGSFCESVTHDGNQHIKHMDEQEESSKRKQCF